MLSVTEKKIDFNGIFKKYLENYDRRSSYTLYDDLYGDCYDGFYDEDYCSWWEQYEDYKKTKSSKKKHQEEDLVWDVNEAKFVPKSEYDKKHKKIKDYNSWDDYINDKDNRTKKSKKTSKKNKKSVIDDYTSNDEVNNKFVYFYTDLTSKKSKITFKSLFEFDEFISNHDYDILDSDIEYLYSHEVVHCAAIKTPEGRMRVVTDNSWGSLVWSCQEVCDLASIES